MGLESSGRLGVRVALQGPDGEIDGEFLRFFDAGRPYIYALLMEIHASMLV
jgi:hypothetical protein